MNIPTRDECFKLLEENKTPENVIDHMKTVCKIAEEIVNRLEKTGITDINRNLVVAGSLLHDIEKVKKDHVLAGGKLIREKGYPEVANVIEKHSLYQIENEQVQPHTWEEKIVFYADKRAKNDKIVSVKERFDDLMTRYHIPRLEKEYTFTIKIEKELLGDNPEINIQ